VRFSKYFGLNASQHELDFVDIDSDEDLSVYVDPYAIEVQDDLWSGNASEHLRVFFTEVLAALKGGDSLRAEELMSKLQEPKETYLGVSKGKPRGRGVGRFQATQLIQALEKSTAYQTGLLQDLSELALYIENFDRDKVSDLTTNVIRGCLIEYTKNQCSVYGIDMRSYNGPPIFDRQRKNWISSFVDLPFIGDNPVMLVPKHIVRRGLSLDSQEFYNKQITDYLVAENLRAMSSLVRVVKGKRKVTKGAVREANPKSKEMIARFVSEHPDVFSLYKSLAAESSVLKKFHEDDPTQSEICRELALALPKIPHGREHASDYELLALGCLVALFHPELRQPEKQWEINSGRKRIDFVFTNAAKDGFFAARRNNQLENAQLVIVECKNYADDLENPEIDQLLGRFDDGRGRFGFIVCRAVDNPKLLINRLLDAAKSKQGFIIVLTDTDIIHALEAKAQLEEHLIEDMLFAKYRELLK
jgi:hypothetical protein